MKRCYFLDKPSNYILLFHGILTLFVLVVSMTLPACAQDERLFDMDYLKGVDTIFVYSSGGPSSKLMPWPPTFNKKYPNIFVSTLNEVFQEQPWVTFTDKMEPEGLTKPNVLNFQFGLTVQEALVEGKPTKIGSISLLIWHREMPMHNRIYFPSHAIPVVPASYPFIVPETTDELYKTLSQGIRFLTMYLPRYFACANKVGEDPCRWGPAPYDYGDFKRGIGR